MRCRTGAQHEHSRSQVNLVERRRRRVLIDGKWCHPTPPPATGLAHRAIGKDKSTEIAAMIGGAARSGRMPRHEYLLAGRQRENEGRFRPVQVNPVDQPVDQRGYALGEELSSTRPRRSPPACAGVGRLFRNPTVGVDAHEESGCRHDLMVDCCHGGNAKVGCPSGDATMKLCTRRTGSGGSRVTGGPAHGVRSPGIRALSTFRRRKARLAVTRWVDRLTVTLPLEDQCVHLEPAAA